MSDTTQAAPARPLFNRTWLAVLTLLSLAIHTAIIITLLWKGDGASALHTNALWWCFFSNGGTLAFLGIGAKLPDDVVSALRK